MKKLAAILLEMTLLLSIALLIIFCTLTQPMLSPATVEQLAEVEALKLASQVKMLSETLPARQSQTNMLVSLEWLESEFNQYAPSYRQSFKVGGETFYNLIIEFGKASPESERIVIGAHYDSAGGLPGADDNASGVAGLIEIARLLSENPPNQHIELVAFAAEEQPYFDTTKMGSYVHADGLKKQGKKVKLMLSLEMLGYFSDKADSQLFPAPLLDLFYPNEGDFIAIIGNLSNIMAVREVKKSFRKVPGLASYSFNAPALVPGIDYSDHRNYWKMGYPAVMITDTAHLRNPNYHTVEDTADKLDYEKMALVIKAVYQLILDLAESN